MRSSTLRSDRRVLILSADGMLPDRITPEVMPTVWGLAQRGVWFRDYHAVYPTHTRV